jgi:hypothetical protein
VTHPAHEYRCCWSTYKLYLKGLENFSLHSYPCKILGCNIFCSKTVHTAKIKSDNEAEKFAVRFEALFRVNVQHFVNPVSYVCVRFSIFFSQLDNKFESFPLII